MNNKNKLINKKEFLEVLDQASESCDEALNILEGINEELEEMITRSELESKWSLSSKAFEQIRNTVPRFEKIDAWNKAEASLQYLKALMECSKVTESFICFKNKHNELMPVLIIPDGLDLKIVTINKGIYNGENYTKEIYKISLLKTKEILNSIILQ